MKDAKPMAAIIKKAKRPLLVIGPMALELQLDGRAFIEYLVDVAKSANVPICATAHTKKKLMELGIARKVPTTSWKSSTISRIPSGKV